MGTILTDAAYTLIPNVGYCESCQQEYVGVCPHFEIARIEAERFEAESREPSKTF